MNDRHAPHARLLAETFHDNWAAGPVAGFARVAAASARRRQRARSTLMASSVATVFAVSGIVAFRSHPVAPDAAVAAIAPTAPVAQAKPAYEVLSDEEFLAQLPDLPLLIEADGHGGRRFTVLETTADESD